MPTWTYYQGSGRLELDGSIVAYGYSGLGRYKNDPGAQDRPNEGPIPRGTYAIGAPFDSPVHGPYCLRLEPTPDTETFGRSCFLIHGDSKEHPGAASHGCIIVPRAVRERVYASRAVLLTVEG